MTMQYQRAYHDGFFDAIDGEPLFVRECSPAYKAGWLAWWDVCNRVNDADFLRTPLAKRLPADAAFEELLPLIRVVITHRDGRIGARTVASPGSIPAAIGAILDGFGEDVADFAVRLLEIEPDELPADADAQRVARRLIANVGRKLLAHGLEE